MILLSEVNLIFNYKALVKTPFSISLREPAHAVLNTGATCFLVALIYILALTTIDIKVFVKVLVAAAFAVIGAWESSYTAASIYYERLLLPVRANIQVHIEILQVTTVSVQ